MHFSYEVMKLFKYKKNCCKTKCLQIKNINLGGINKLPSWYCVRYTLEADLIDHMAAIYVKCMSIVFVTCLQYQGT